MISKMSFLMPQIHNHPIVYHDMNMTKQLIARDLDQLQLHLQSLLPIVIEKHNYESEKEIVIIEKEKQFVIDDVTNWISFFAPFEHGELIECIVYQNEMELAMDEYELSFFQIKIIDAQPGDVITIQMKFYPFSFYRK